VGYVEDEDYDEVIGKSSDVKRQIMRTPASTLEGLAVKARAALLHECDPIDADYDLARQELHALDEDDEPFDAGRSLSPCI
jgi:hypothetical protein